MITGIVVLGFGYHHPTDDNSRLFTIFVMIFGIFVIFGGISTALTHRLADFKLKRRYGDLENSVQIYKDLQTRLAINLFAILINLFAAAIVFYSMENWSFTRALYFAVQTATVCFTTVLYTLHLLICSILYCI